MGMSNADRQKKYRQKRDASPNRRQEYLLKEKQKYKRDIERKKKKCVKDMTEREKRSARKRWRLYKQQVRAKQKKVSESKSPPKSPSSACSSHQKLSRKEKKNREKAKCYRENKLLKDKIVNLEKKHAIYRKRLQRAKEQSSNDALKGNVLTPRSKTRKLLRNFSKKEVKRALLFHNALIDQLRLAHKLRQAVSPVPGILSGSIIRKYKLKSVAMRSCGIHTRNKLLQRSSLSRRMYKIVQEFYERDDVSRITAGMKNTVTKKKSKKQRRILCDSLQNLHQKYLSENPPMSYSTFCRLRPFWVLFPSERDRNKCQCKLCENTNFMFRALKNANVLEAQSLDELLEGREWNYDKKKRNDEIQWEEWTTKSEKREIKRGNKFERKNVLQRKKGKSGREQLFASY
ncbi:trichohyalin-like [Magallana gigas]|uniref:trichohyalin-like n=1 Tax=Magallana gigas TaxID=29159 RepID=UPI003342B31C